MGISEEKAALRTRYRLERKARYMENSFAHLSMIPEFQSARVIASYISYGVEPDTRALNQEVIAAGKLLVVPRINGQDLDWVAWDGDQQKISKVKSLQEPTGPALSDLSTIDLIFVPALCIDRSGYRLGQGGGYYDRALAKISAFSIGLIHPDEIAGQDLPRESFDIPLNAAATPDLTLRFKR